VTAVSLVSSTIVAVERNKPVRNWFAHESKTEPDARQFDTLGSVLFSPNHN
jgi:hypothetical protein